MFPVNFIKVGGLDLLRLGLTHRRKAITGKHSSLTPLTRTGVPRTRVMGIDSSRTSCYYWEITLFPVLLLLRGIGSSLTPDLVLLGNTYPSAKLGCFPPEPFVWLGLAGVLLTFTLRL